MRVKGSLVLLALALMLAVPHLAMAANPVHNFDCKNCHLSGLAINQLGGANVCLTCHGATPATITTPLRGNVTSDGGFVVGDASNHYLNNPAPDLETSHNWAATSTNPAAGAAEPNRTLHPGFYSRYGTTVGKVACSRCHDPHGDYVLNRKLLPLKSGVPMSPNEMCVACHKAFADSMQTDHGLLSHPMITDYNAFQSGNSTKYKAGLPAYNSALPYANNVQLVNGGVSCLSCHNLHFTDSDSSTTDGPTQTLNQGDGLMLRGNGSQFTVTKGAMGTFPTGDSICNKCHNYETSVHGPGSDIGCLACHGGHNYNNNNPTYYMLNDPTGSYATRPTTGAEKSLAWGGDTAGVIDGFCESCHGNIETDWNTVRDHTVALGAEDCTICHLDHGQGSFSQPIGCDGCHGSPPQNASPGNSAAPGYALNGYAWAPNGSNTASQYDYADVAHYKDETTTPHTSHAGAGSNYKFQCKLCHNTHIDNFAGTHNKDNTSFRDVLEAASTFDSKVIAAGAGNPSYNDGHPTGTCSTVYCHSNGGVNNGAGVRAFGFNNPSWAAGLKGSVVGTGSECSFCHGNSTATMTTRANSAGHQKHLSQGFGCNLCHVSTATSSTDLVGAPTSPPAVHINQTVNVAFDTASALKAGGAAVAHGTNPYSDAASMTCSAVYCHSSGQSVVGDRTYRTVTWKDAPLDCTGCHDVHNDNNASPSHLAHVSGAASDLGRNLDCGVCHADTVTVGNNNAITGATKHVNGLVDIKMNIFDDTGSCSSIDCHSDGNFDGTVTYKNATWGTPLAGCDDCHGDGSGITYPSYANGGLGGDSNSHSAHVGGGISCSECHSATTASDTAIDGTTPSQHVNKTVEIVGTKITSYTPASETCSAAACHGAGTPQWGGIVACGSCHAANNTLAQSHPAHYNVATAGSYALETNSSTAADYIIQCGVCHSTNGAGAISHAGGWQDSTAPNRRTAEVNFDGTLASGTYAPGASETLDNGFYYTDATCSALYCHGNFGGNGNVATATWGNAASGACGTCHDVDTSPSMSGGVHDVHVKSIGITCDYCHKGTAVNAAGGIANRSLHVNQLLNWELDASKAQLTASSAYRGTNSGTRSKAAVGTLPYGACSNIYCHSDVQASPPNGVVGVTYATPNWGGVPAVNCGDCHNAGPAGGVTVQTSGSHSDHVSSSKYAIGCTQCHQGAGTGTTKHADYAVDVVINATWGGTYAGSATPGDAYSTCSTVYCHSNGQTGAGRVNNTPTWGTTINNCTACHQGATAGTDLSGAHEAHVVAAQAATRIGKTLGCVDCHTTTVSDNTTIASYTDHVNGAVDVMSCATNNCHSNGNYGALVYNSPTFATGSYDCTTCHGNGTTQSYPSYADGNAGTANSNSHNAHVGSSSITCLECHKDTSTAGTSIDGTTPAQHVDGTIDVVFNQTGSYVDATDTCSTTYCHGAGTPVWGGAALNCDACHSASSALADSHGVHYNSATVATAINTDNDSTAGKYIFQCGNCHNATTHAGGEANAGIQAAEVSLAGSGTYTPAGTTAGTDRNFKYTAGSCNTNDCHNDGTAAKGAPNYNGATLQWSVTSLPADCTGCHDNNAAAAQTMASGSHTAHVNDGTIMANKTCNSCHNVTVDGTDRAIASKVQHLDGTQDVDLAATYGGAFAANACNNVYCHSDGKATPTYKSVTWGTTINDCVSCHQGATAGTTLSGAHEEHVVNAGATIGKNLGCVVCHGATVSDNTTISTPANHVNKAVNVISCATNQCHSNGNFGATLIQYNPNFATDTLGCANCHGNGTVSYPIYANTGSATPNANSHVTHIVGGGYTCEECHATTSTAGGSINGTDGTQHVDGDIDVNGSSIGSFLTGTCNTIACHGGNSATWGASLGCRDCHGDATTDTDDFVYNNGTFAKVALNEWSFSGHGKAAAANYEVTGRAGADFEAASTTGDACLYCHDGSVSHGAANYFRLRQNGGPDLNGACLGCHATGSTGVDPDGATTVFASKNSTVKIDKYHGGAGHNLTDRDAGRWCWDCHDPHGDAAVAGDRIQMIQKRPHQDPNANGVPASLAGTDVIFIDRTVGAGAGGFARSAAPFGQGICNSCHTATDQYTQTLGDNGHPTTQCTVCHKHGDDGVYDGNAFKGSGCNGCHGNSTLGNYWPDSTAGAAIPAANDAGRHAKHIEVLAAQVYSQTTAQLLADAATDTKQQNLCTYCHDTPGADGDHGFETSLPADVNSMKKLWDGSADDAAWSLAGDSGNGTCATTDCHNNKTTPTGYSWYGATASACIMCHTDVTVSGGAGSTGQTHVAHSGAALTYGRAGLCADCHDPATSWATNTKPAVNHINGAFVVGGGNVTLTYSGATYPTVKGTCGTTECHNSGRNAAPVVDPTWGTTMAGCGNCHPFVPAQGHTPHFASTGTIVNNFPTLAGGAGCNVCHTHSGNNATHINKQITLAAAMNYNSAVLNLDVVQAPDYGTCSTQTCHQNGRGTASLTPFWNRAPQSSDDCTLCHFNGAPASTFSHDTHIGATTPGVTSYLTAASNASTATEYRFNCANCHGNTLANHLNSATWATPTVNVAAGVNYNAGADTCSSNSCHTNGTGGAALLTANWTTGWVGDGDSDTCNNCHGNSPTSSAHQVHAVGIHATDIYSGSTGLLTTATATKSHGDAATSTTINCNLCHSQTVTSARNKWGSECASCHNGDAAGTVMGVADKSKHVDGSKQVVFAMTTFKSKAQVRDDITTVPELDNNWARNNGYKAATSFDQVKLAPAPAWSSGPKTCSTVDCHNGITATWAAPANNCMACHTNLPQ